MEKNISRRNLISLGTAAGISLAYTSMASASATASMVDAGKPTESAQQQAIIEGLRKEELYLPTPAEVLALSGSQAEAKAADDALRSLSASDLKINLNLKAEQDKLTAKYRSQHAASLDKPRVGMDANAYSTTAIGSIRVEIMDAWGSFSDYSHVGDRSVLPRQAQAWRPNFSNSRVHASYDPTNGSSWWSVW